MMAYKIASVAVCYNFIRRDLSWNWISNLVARLAVWTLTESRKIREHKTKQLYIKTLHKLD